MRGRGGFVTVLALALATGGVLAARPVSALGVGVGVGGGVGVGVDVPAEGCGHLDGSATLRPGLSDAPTNVTIRLNGTLSRCSSSWTGNEGSFSSTIKVTAATCSGWEGSILTGTGVTTWSTQRVSKYSLTYSIGTGDDALVATITGKVTSGLWSGRRVSTQVKFQHVGSANCATIPVTDLTFDNTRPFVIS
jgi:hypothetical protein